MPVDSIPPKPLPAATMPNAVATDPGGYRSTMSAPIVTCHASRESATMAPQASASGIEGAQATKTKQAAASHLRLFGGLNGQFLLEELGRGATGTMPGSDLTAIFVRIWSLWQKDQDEHAREAFGRYLPLIRYELQPGLGVSVMKLNLHEWGIIASPRVRHPPRTVDDIGRRELVRSSPGRTPRFTRASDPCSTTG